MSSKVTARRTLRSTSLGSGNVYSSRILTIPEFWHLYVPTYQSRNYGHLHQTLRWEPGYAEEIKKISERRYANRITSYLDEQEVARVGGKLRSKGEASIRFGAQKIGHGYDGERGDFCLVGGVIKGRDLTILYRSLELMGGFAYDLTLLHHLENELRLNFKTVTIFACKAFTFALKGNSNERLYPKLKSIFRV